jgi:hypothetical protein
MREINQKLRFNTAELALTKALFADNEELLFAVRKVMLQMPLMVGEQAVVNGLTDEAFELMKKYFLPELDGDSPIFQMADLTLGLGADIKGLSPDGAWPFIKAKELEIDFVAQQLEVLRGREPKTNVSLKELADLSGAKTTREQKYINLLAWNFLLSFVDSNINQMKVLAGLKTESVEQTIERLAKNSNK